VQEFIDYFPLVLSGTWVTIEVAVLSLVVSFVFGMVGALWKLSDRFALKKIATFYTTLIRGVPDLILILIFYYGGQFIANKITESLEWDYYNFPPFAAGVITIGFIYGAYMVEVFRGAILAIKKGQIEAGHAFGMSSFKIFYRITLPLMVRFAIPGFMNNWLVLIKSTALISIIGLEDVVRKANIAGSITKKPFTFLFTASMIYVVITSVSVIFITLFERRYRAIE